MKADLRAYIILYFFYWLNWSNMRLQVNFSHFDSLNMLFWWFYWCKGRVMLLSLHNSQTKNHPKEPQTKPNSPPPTPNKPTTHQKKTLSVALSTRLCLSWWKRWDSDEPGGLSAERVMQRALPAVPKLEAELSSTGQVCWVRAGGLLFC